MESFLTFSSELPGIASVILLVAAVLAALPSFLPLNRIIPEVSKFLATTSLALFFVWFAERWYQYVKIMCTSWLKAFPVSTFYESIVFIAIVFLTLLLLMRHRIRDPIFQCTGLFCCSVAVLFAGLLGTNQTGVVPFAPTLKNYWLIAHVFMSFTAYALFFMACLLAIFSLLKNRCSENIAIIRSTIGVGIAFFSIGGIVFGAIWAQHSWGRFWGWDPKETWALITWCAYLLILHFDACNKLTPKHYCVCTSLAFGIVGFTFIGVNILFAGLHSYASL